MTAPTISAPLRTSLVVGLDAHQIETVVHDANDERADKGSGDATDATRQAGAASDDRCDGVQFITDTRLRQGETRCGQTESSRQGPPTRLK